MLCIFLESLEEVTSVQTRARDKLRRPCLRLRRASEVRRNFSVTSRTRKHHTNTTYNQCFRCYFHLLCELVIIFSLVVKIDIEISWFVDSELFFLIRFCLLVFSIIKYKTFVITSATIIPYLAKKATQLHASSRG